MNPPRLYNDLARYWPLLNPPQDYLAEADALRDLLGEHLGRAPSHSHSLLELGAGAGHSLFHLTDQFEVAAVDICEPMVRLCRQLNPNVEAHVADMRSVRLDRTFDAVLAHDAIDYMTTLEDVDAVCQTAATHLKPGGLFVIGPTYVLENFVDHEVAQQHVQHGSMDLTYVSYVHRLEQPSTIELVILLLICENKQLRIEEDRHICGLFATETWCRHLEKAGFKITRPLCFEQINDVMPSCLITGIRC